jgi:hypothetical protein
MGLRSGHLALRDSISKLTSTVVIPCEHGLPDFKNKISKDFHAIDNILTKITKRDRISRQPL